MEVSIAHSCPQGSQAGFTAPAPAGDGACDTNTWEDRGRWREGGELCCALLSCQKIHGKKLQTPCFQNIKRL